MHWLHAKAVLGVLGAPEWIAIGLMLLVLSVGATMRVGAASANHHAPRTRRARRGLALAAVLLAMIVGFLVGRTFAG